MSDCYTHNPYVPYMPDTNHVDSCPHTAVDNTLVIRMVCARSSCSAKWLLGTRTTTTAILLRSRFPSRDLYGFHPYHRRGKSLAHGLRTKSAPYGFTARSTLVAYRYLGQTFGDTQDVSRWLWLLLPLHRYGVSRHRAITPSVSSQFSATRQGILQVCRCSVSHVTLYGLG